jgi:hypothetical protein
VEHPPKLLSRHQGHGVLRETVYTLDGGATSTEFLTPATPVDPLRIELVLLDADQMATLEQLIAGTGLITVRLSPTDPGQEYMWHGPQIRDPHWGHHPEGADPIYQQWRAELAFIDVGA